MAKLLVPVALLVVVQGCAKKAPPKPERAAEAEPGRAHGVHASITEVRVGFAHSCALVKGQACCWGWNKHHEVGESTEEAVLTPKLRRTSKRLVSLDLGTSFSCGVDVDGGVWCWGQADDSLAVPSASPRKIALPEPMEGIDTGVSEVCGVSKNGVAYCWGELALENGAPQRLPGKTKSVQVHDDLLCRLSDRKLKCEHLEFEKEWFTETAPEVEQFSLGYNLLCGVTLESGVWCNGDDYDGQPGLDLSAPSALASSGYALLKEPIASVSAGGESACAVTATGQVYCWGKDFRGSLGRGDDGEPNVDGGKSELKAVRIPRARQIDTFGGHTCALTDDGVYCWGNNFSGMLGTGDRKNRGGRENPTIVRADLSACFAD